MKYIEAELVVVEFNSVVPTLVIHSFLSKSTMRCHIVVPFLRPVRVVASSIIVPYFFLTYPIVLR